VAAVNAAVISGQTDEQIKALVAELIAARTQSAPTPASVMPLAKGAQRKRATRDRATVTP